MKYKEQEILGQGKLKFNFDAYFLIYLYAVH